MAVASGLLERAVQETVKSDAEAAEVADLVARVEGVVVSAGTTMLQVHEYTRALKAFNMVAIAPATVAGGGSEGVGIGNLKMSSYEVCACVV